MGASVTLWEATAPVKLPTRPGPWPGLRAQVRTTARAEWYFTVASPKASATGSPAPTYPTQRAPRPMTSWSKAPRGLFVLSWVARIFTGPSISPSPSSRQCPSRYAFRAGRNLPDKEFRYLRTVIVTAAVHRGFGSGLAPLPLTFRHWAGVSPYTSASPRSQRPVFLVNSRLGLFSAAPSRSTGEPLHATRGTPSPEVTGSICRVP